MSTDDQNNVKPIREGIAVPGSSAVNPSALEMVERLHADILAGEVVGFAYCATHRDLATSYLYGGRCAIRGMIGCCYIMAADLVEDERSAT